MSKRTTKELIRLALIYAVQDRESYADADSGPDGKEAKRLAKEFRAYHAKRYGTPHLTWLDKALANSKTVTLDELRASNPKDTPND